MNAKLITSIIIVGLAAIVFFQNSALVDLKFLFWTHPTPMTLTMFLVFSTGIITGWLVRGTYRKSHTHTHNK